LWLYIPRKEKFPGQMKIIYIRSIRESFSGVKSICALRYYTPPSSADVENDWSCTSIRPYVFVACSFIKHKHKFTFKIISAAGHGSRAV
jgi:hypothetical protein